MVAVALPGCGVVQRAPDIGKSAIEAVNPMNWFGGDGNGEKNSKGKSKSESESNLNNGDTLDGGPALAMPGSMTVGTVHMVERRNDFLLIKASRLTKIDYGTMLISQNADGHQTAELKVSPERNSQFLVADIVRGDPEVGDVVKLIGVRSEDGSVVPVGGDEVQVLE